MYLSHVKLGINRRITQEMVTLDIQVRSDKRGLISKKGQAGLSGEKHLKTRCLRRDFLFENQRWFGGFQAVREPVMWVSKSVWHFLLTKLGEKDLPAPLQRPNLEHGVSFPNAPWQARNVSVWNATSKFESLPFQSVACLLLPWLLCPPFSRII